MKTLHIGLRVADLDRSLAFYAALGYVDLGHVPDTPIGHLAMLKLPDDPFVTLELVHRPDDDVPTDSTLSHLVIQVEDLRATIADLAEHGITTEEPTSPDDRADFLTCLLDDPDGNRIELVQWPPGHADGMTEADLSED